MSGDGRLEPAFQGEVESHRWEVLVPHKSGPWVILGARNWSPGNGDLGAVEQLAFDDARDAIRNGHRDAKLVRITRSILDGIHLRNDRVLLSMDPRTDAQIATEAMLEQSDKADKAAAMMSDVGSFVRTQLWEALNVVGYPAHGDMVQAPKKVCKLVNYIGEKWIDSLVSVGTLRADGEQAAIKMLLKDGKL